MAYKENCTDKLTAIKREYQIKDMPKGGKEELIRNFTEAGGGVS